MIGWRKRKNFSVERSTIVVLRRFVCVCVCLSAMRRLCGARCEKLTTIFPFSHSCRRTAAIAIYDAHTRASLVVKRRAVAQYAEQCRTRRARRARSCCRQLCGERANGAKHSRHSFTTWRKVSRDCCAQPCFCFETIAPFFALCGASGLTKLC